MIRPVLYGPTKLITIRGADIVQNIGFVDRGERRRERSFQSLQILDQPVPVPGFELIPALLDGV